MSVGPGSPDRLSWLPAGSTLPALALSALSNICLYRATSSEERVHGEAIVRALITHTRCRALRVAPAHTPLPLLQWPHRCVLSAVQRASSTLESRTAAAAAASGDSRAL